MGNLQISKLDKSQYQRKPIFENSYSPFRQQNSRSLSPYLLKTSRYIANKNSIIRGAKRPNMNLSGINRVYLNPAMVKSVIKDSRNQADVSNSSIRLKKSFTPTPNQQNSISLSRSAFLKPTQSPYKVPKYTERQFQQQSPNKHNESRALPKQQFSTEKQNKNVRFHENMVSNTNSQSNTNKNINFQQVMQFKEFKDFKEFKENNHKNKEYNLSSVKKSNLNTLNNLISGHDSSRNYGADGHMLSPSYYRCFCHGFQLCPHEQLTHTLVSEQRQLNQQDNAPTERKKSNQTPIYSPSMPSQVKNTRLKTQQPTNLQPFKILDTEMHAQNHQKCQQIIKRVRNFNEFLNEIKKKVKKEYQHYQSNMTGYVSHEQSLEDHSANVSIDNQRHNSSFGTQGQDRKGQTGNCKSITLALRLQNQKIQLEKYRKMVERELSKQHSIQSIEIQSKNKQKIITINFEKDPKFPQKNPQLETNFTKKEALDKFEGQLQSKTVKTKLKTKNEKMKKQKNDDLEMKYKKIGKLAQKTENSGQQIPQLKIVDRMSKINTLFTKIEGINQQQVDSYRQIFHILKKNQENQED